MRYRVSKICDLNKSSIKKGERFSTILYLDTSSATNGEITKVQEIVFGEEPSRAKRKVQDETIVYSTVRPNLRHFAFLSNPEKNFIVSTGFVTIDVKSDYLEEIEPYYLYLQLTRPSIIEKLQKIAVSAVSAYPSFNPSDLGDLEIDFPSIQEQKKIVQVLFSLDENISLNHRINDRLRQTIRDLYDYWFLQFDFPDANGNPYRTSGGAMTYNATLKREIPAGWEVKSLGELIGKLSSGKRPGAIDKSLKKGIPSLGAECIDELGVFNYASTPFVADKFRPKMTSGLIEDRDILIYKDGAYVGKTTMFQDKFPYQEAFVNEHVFLLHCKNEDLQEYLLFTLKLPMYFEIMQFLGRKAAQPGLNQTDLKSVLVAVPDDTILAEFRHQVADPMHMIFNNSLEAENLRKTREELLPLLMNGQVTITE